MPLEVIDGLQVLILRGTPGEMGIEHGRLLKDYVHLAVEGFLRRSARAFEVPYPHLREAARFCSPYIPDAYVEEMHGLAESSEVPYEDILAINCLVDVDGCYQQSQLHCCNFVLGSPATAEGLLIHGRNLDFPPFRVLPRIAVAIVRQPSDMSRLPTLAIAWAGFTGMLTGYSAARLSVGEIGVPAKDASLEGTPIGVTIRDMLESCDSVEACTKRLSTSRRTCGYNLALCDGKTGESAGVEMTRDLCEWRPGQEGILIVDDVCFCRRTGRNRLGHPAGAFRFARMMQLVHGRKGSIGLEDAFSFLRDCYDLATAQPNGRSYNCICNRNTIQSVLFLPSARRVFIAHGQSPAPKGAYHDLDLSKFM